MKEKLNKITFLIFSGCVFILIILMIVETSVFKRKFATQENEINYWKALAEKCYPPLPPIVTEVTGRVERIEDSTIFLSFSERISRFPLPEGKDFLQKTIRVKTSPTTLIEKLKIVEDEQGGYVAKTLKSSFQEIKIGDRITVVSKENIKGKSEIIASKILIGGE